MISLAAMVVWWRPGPIGKAAELVLFVRVKGCGNGVLRGRRETS